MSRSENSVGIPAFLTKLWKMVDDPKTNDLICWAEDGKSFTIRNEMSFWYELLPLYYKHNNMSSFVRQLNLYGFHKISGLSHQTADDKNEYQFMHPYFSRDSPHLLKLIKRKVANSKILPATEKVLDNVGNNDQLLKVLSDVKQLHGRQSQVDSAINNMQQDNSVLWRELVLLRQKHQKLQEIVNKLIQFLVTIVQPSRVSGLGLKRQFPLMIKSNPKKKKKTTVDDRPTIHELDADTDELLNSSAFEMENLASTSQGPDEILNDEVVDSIPVIEQPLSAEMPDQNLPVDDGSLNYSRDYPEYVDAFEIDSTLSEPAKDALLNPSSGDAILSNILDDETKKQAGDMTVATLNPIPPYQRLNSLEDMNNHIITTQTELEQLKDFLNGCSSIDSSMLLSLFNEMPSCGLPSNINQVDIPEEDLLGGSELTPYDASAVDFNELFDDNDCNSIMPAPLIEANASESINTPDVKNVGPPSFNLNSGELAQKTKPEIKSIFDLNEINS